jgi:hypothetical protein
VRDDYDNIVGFASKALDCVTFGEALGDLIKGELINDLSRC